MIALVNIIIKYRVNRIYRKYNGQIENFSNKY